MSTHTLIIIGIAGGIWVLLILGIIVVLRHRFGER